MNSFADNAKAGKRVALRSSRYWRPSSVELTVKVVAADTADNIGEIKGFVVDQGANRIESLHVAGRGASLVDFAVAWKKPEGQVTNP